MHINQEYTHFQDAETKIDEIDFRLGRCRNAPHDQMRSYCSGMHCLCLQYNRKRIYVSLRRRGGNLAVKVRAKKPIENSELEKIRIKIKNKIISRRTRRCGACDKHTLVHLYMLHASIILKCVNRQQQC